MLNITNSLKGILEPINDIIDKFVFLEEEKANLKTSLIKTQQQINLIALEIERNYTLAYQKILLIDAQNESKITRLWRPILSLAFGGIVVIAVFTNILHAYIPSIQEVVLNTEIWNIILAMIGITSFSRGVEKIVKNIKNSNGNGK